MLAAVEPFALSALKYGLLALLFSLRMKSMPCSISSPLATQRQLLAMRGDADDELYSRKYLLTRPLLEAIESPEPCVLLIDEIDRADDEFEAFLLELLSDFQVSIPELGTIVAARRPVVILTSNRTRELHDALKRRCLYHWIDFPDLEREIEIIKLRVPGVSEQLARAVSVALARDPAARHASAAAFEAALIASAS